MSRKLPWITIIAGTMLLITLLWLQTPRTVAAQCSNPSSCKTCHEVQGQKPVNTVGAWHTDHVPFDACVVCHGGNREAKDKAAAHAGIVNKLQDMPAACQNCHTTDLESVFKVYADQLGVTDTSVVAAAQQSGGWANKLGSALGSSPASVSAATPTPQPSTEPVEPPANRAGNWILGLMLIAGIGGGSTYVVRNERRLRSVSTSTAAWYEWVWLRFRQELWSPYAAGVLLGIVGILTVLLTQHLMSASGGIAVIASSLLAKAAPSVSGKTMYFKFIMPPGFNWQVTLLIGIFIGGFLASLSSRTFRLRWNGDPTWTKIYGPARWKRFVVGFLGAILIQYGAGIAGGCTSGLAISGGMLLAPSAFLFMAGMFASGILVALLVYRRRY